MIRYLPPGGAARGFRSLITRGALGAALALATTATSWCIAAPSWADGSSVTVSLSPSLIAANGTSSTQANVAVNDPSVSPTDTIQVTSSDPGDIVGPVSQNPDGTFSATITSSMAPGQATITATDTSLASSPSGQATLTQYGSASSVTIHLSPTSMIVANGASTTTAIATIEDAEQDPVPGDTVTFSSTDAGDRFGAVTDNGDGTYSTTVTSSASAGTPTITATDSSASPSPSGQAALTQTAGPATHVSVALAPGSIVANGTAQTTATATVLDAHGNPVSGDTVAFSSSDPGDYFGSVTDHGDGTYTATLTSSKAAGTPTITATDTSTNVSGQRPLTQTPGPATHVSVALAPESIVANGVSQSNATATVTDANGNPVGGDSIAFSSSDPGDRFGSVSDHGDGTYTASLTSSKTAGTPTITATDTSTNSSGQSVVTQTAGPAMSVRVALQPSTIVADGVAQSTAVATVRDANGNSVDDDDVMFSSSDSGELVGQTVNNHDGTYSANVRSSTNVGQATITATDQSAQSLQGQASLTQTNSPSHTVLAVSPSSAVSNQPVTLLAAITAASGQPSGTISFENGGAPIAGCANESVSPSGPTASCSTSFAATSGSPQLAAVFVPDASSTVAGSSGSASLDVVRDSTSTSLRPSSPAPEVGTKETYLATVAPAHAGSLTPSGAVSFLDNGQPVGQCANQPITSSGVSWVASCTTSYSGKATHAITAVYGGDGNFLGSSSLPSSVQVQYLGTLGATMRWSFISAAYTKVLALVVDGASAGSTVQITCHGRGCPFTTSSAAVTKTVRCETKGKSTCATNGVVNLTSRFAKQRLRPGTTITVKIVRAGWIGKSYTFVVRASHAPRTASALACVTPSGSAAAC